MSDPVTVKETSESMRVVEEESDSAPEPQVPTSSDSQDRPEPYKEESCQDNQKETQVNPPHLSTQPLQPKEWVPSSGTMLDYAGECNECTFQVHWTL